MTKIIRKTFVTVEVEQMEVSKTCMTLELVPVILKKIVKKLQIIMKSKGLVIMVSFEVPVRISGALNLFSKARFRRARVGTGIVLSLEVQVLSLNFSDFGWKKIEPSTKST